MWLSGQRIEIQQDLVQNVSSFFSSFSRGLAVPLRLVLSCGLDGRCQRLSFLLCSHSELVPRDAPLLIHSLIRAFVGSDSALNSCSPPAPQSCLWRVMLCGVVLTPAQLFPILFFLNGSSQKAVRLLKGGELCRGEEGSCSPSQPGHLSIQASACWPNRQRNGCLCLTSGFVSSK